MERRFSQSRPWLFIAALDAVAGSVLRAAPLALLTSGRHIELTIALLYDKTPGPDGAFDCGDIGGFCRRAIESGSESYAQGII